MANLEELVIQLTADTKSLQADMKSAVQIMGKSTDEMKKSVDTFSKGGSKSTSMFQNAVGTMAGFIGSQVVIGAFNLLKDAVVSAFSEGIEGAAEAQDAFLGFSLALKNIGQYSKEGAESFKEFADGLQNTSGIAAEATLNTGKMIATLTGLSGPQLQEATLALANMSVVMGVDMENASRMFARGVNGGMEAFKKFGITIKEGSNQMENTQNIIEALNNKFQGGADVAGKTYSGALNILKKSFGEVLESIGQIIVENPVLIATMREISGTFLGLAKYLENNNTSFKQLAAEGILVSIEALRFFNELTKIVMETLKGLLTSMAEPFRSLYDRIIALKMAVSGDLVGATKVMEEQAKRMQQAYDIPVFDKIDDGLVNMSTKLNLVLGDMMGGADVASTALGGIKNNVNGVSESLTASEKAAQSWALSLAESANSVQETYGIDLEVLKAQFDSKLISEEEYLISKQEMQASYLETERTMLEEALAKNHITKEQYDNANLALSNKHNIAIMQQMAAQTKFEKDQQTLRQEQLKSTLGNIATISSSSNKTLAGIGKAAAVAQATMDGYVAIQKALASGVPPYNIALAASIGIKTASNIAGIVGTPLATGIDSVPGIGSNDNFPAVLAPQERVVPRETNKDLTEFLANQGGSKTSINVNISISDVFTSDPREVGLKIIETINEAAQANGITLLGSNIS